jgi:hypothetical protein
MVERRLSPNDQQDGRQFFGNSFASETLNAPSTQLREVADDRLTMLPPKMSASAAVKMTVIYM